MSGEGKSEMACAEFDALITESMDGTLNGERRERFEQHKSNCAVCQALFAEVKSGLAWLDEMEDVVPPTMLVRNILAATSGAAQRETTAEPQASAWERLRRRAGAVFAPVLTARFGMSMGMAFFSITLLLDMAQIPIKDLTPHNLSHTFYSTENKVMKYYENMRLVYEIESRVRNLRDNGEEREREEQMRRQEKNNNQTRDENQNSQPERRQPHEFGRIQNVQWPASLSENEAHCSELAKQRREI